MATEQPEIEDWMYPYVAGALDFASGIHVKVQKSSSHSLGYTISPYIVFSNTAQTPLGMIDMFCEQYDINTTMNERESGSYILKINGVSNVKTLLEQLNPYLIGSTEKVNIMMHNIIPALERGDHTTRQDTFIDVMDSIEEFREYDNARKESKYTREFFEDEWGR